jgi:hypothetical protein
VVARASAARGPRALLAQEPPLPRPTQGVAVRSTAGTSRTLVTERALDGRYALVETELELALELDPEPAPEALAELLELAERDCFVGSSLTAKPSYRWAVNGRTLA